MVKKETLFFLSSFLPFLPPLPSSLSYLLSQQNVEMFDSVTISDVFVGMLEYFLNRRLFSARVANARLRSRAIFAG